MKSHKRDNIADLVDALLDAAEKKAEAGNLETKDIQAILSLLEAQMGIGSGIVEPEPTSAWHKIYAKEALSVPAWIPYRPKNPAPTIGRMRKPTS